jgi:hypothetical protein
VVVEYQTRSLARLLLAAAAAAVESGLVEPLDRVVLVAAAQVVLQIPRRETTVRRTQVAVVAEGQQMDQTPLTAAQAAQES